MALTITPLNSGTNGTGTANNTTLTVTGVTASVGDVLLLCIAAGNSGSFGAAAVISSIADNASGSTNVYTQRGTTGNRTAGATNDGASQFFFECPVTTELDNATITITFSANNPDKAVQVYRLQPGSGEAVEFVSVGTALAGSGRITHSATTISVTNGNTIFAMAAIEINDAVTGDSDTTNGSWSAIQTRLDDNGVDTQAMSSSSQWKTVNATGNQAWACTTTTGRDSVANTIIYRARLSTTYNESIPLSPSADLTAAGGLAYNSTAEFGATMGLDPSALVSFAATASISAQIGVTASSIISALAPASIGMTAQATGASTLQSSAAAAIAAALAITSSGGINYDVSAGLSMSSGMTSAGAISIAASSSFGFAHSFSGAAQASFASAATLAALASISSSGVGSFASVAALASDLGLSASSAATVAGAVSLAMALAETSGGSLTMAAAISAAMQAGFVSSGAITAQGVASMAMLLAQSAEAPITSTTYDEAIALVTSAALAAVGGGEINQQASIAMTPQALAQSTLVTNAGAALGAAIAQSVTAALRISSSAGLSFGMTTLASGSVVVSGVIALPASAGLAGLVSGEFDGAVEFVATFDETAAVRLDANAMATLAAALTLHSTYSVGAAHSIALAGKIMTRIDLAAEIDRLEVALSGELAGSTRLKGLLDPSRDLAGHVQLVIGLRGRLRD